MANTIDSAVDRWESHLVHAVEKMQKGYFNKIFLMWPSTDMRATKLQSKDIKL